MNIIVTIDVEEDASADWSSAERPSFVGVTEGIKNHLMPLFSDLGIHPTLMISPIVLQSIESVDALSRLEKVELAAHLHWEQIGPHAERVIDNGRHTLRHMQADHTPDIERAKLETLTELFRQQFGVSPTSFRAGRYGASHATGALLKELDYLVDSSATPHVNWQTPKGGIVDYSRVPENPYMIGDNGDLFQHGSFDLLEVPITIMAQDQFPGLSQAPWLRPTYASVETMKEMVRIVRARNAQGIEQPLVMMFHNVEVIPGASPYTATVEDVRAYVQDMRDVLSYAIDQGFKPSTLTEYARDYKRRHPLPPQPVEPKAPSAQAIRKPRILFSVDAEGWAHDFKSTNLIKHLSHRFDCRKRFESNISREDFEWADIVIVYYWGQFGALQPFYDIMQRKTVLTGISCPTDLEGDRHEIGLKILNNFHAVFVHNQMLHDEYAPQIIKPFYLNQNGVDTTFYCPGPARTASSDLVVGWAGSLANHGNKRGYHDIIVPAVAMTPGVVLHTAAREDKWRGPNEMLEFYRGLDVYLVASRVEGTPNPGLESAACGVPVISTRVGNMPELIRNGENGFLIDERTPEAFSARLAYLRDSRDLLRHMSIQMRQDILAWDWAIMAKKYERMIDETLARYAV